MVFNFDNLSEFEKLNLISSIRSDGHECMKTLINISQKQEKECIVTLKNTKENDITEEFLLLKIIVCGKIIGLIRDTNYLYKICGEVPERETLSLLNYVTQAYKIPRKMFAYQKEYDKSVDEVAYFHNIYKL